MIARVLKLLAIAVATHGLAVALFAIAVEPRLGDDVPEFLASFVFFALFVPASLLVLPVRPILWNLGLIETPGWFTWPKPLGYVLAYLIWVVGLMALSLLAARLARAKPTPGVQP